MSSQWKLWFLIVEEVEVGVVTDHGPSAFFTIQLVQLGRYIFLA
jgi:hypothetical protein